MDLTRSTGFHRLQVGPTTWWFSTEDAKLGLEGIETMLRVLQTSGTGWSGQILFSDGAVLRDAHVVYSWLDQWADGALDAVRRVLDAPRFISRNDQSLSRRGGRSVHQSATLRLLRSRPDRYLERSATGLLEVGGARYDPLRVVVRNRTSTIDSPANRRAVAVLLAISRLAEEVLSARPHREVAARCKKWHADAAVLQRRPVARGLRIAAPGALPVPRQTEESVDARYRATFGASKGLAGLFGWSASRMILPHFSYVDRSDTIYQAFVATALADALGLTQTASVLGQKALAFSGPEYDLYYDTPPPAAVLRSWRHHSSRPDASRPDVLIHRRSTGEVLIIDAKYRQDGTSATEDSRKEVSAYMALYGLDQVVIAYPATVPAVLTAITARGKTIWELPISPTPGLGGELKAALPHLMAEMRLPAY